VDNFDAAKTLFVEGLRHIQDKEYEQAEGKLRSALELVPHRISTLTNLSAVLIKLKKYDEAEKVLQDILAIDKTAAQAWLNYGLIEKEKSSNYPRAMEHFDKALEIDPDYPEAWLNKGVALYGLGRHQEAIDSYRKAIAIRPDYADGYCNLGNALQWFNRMDEALASYDEAIKLDPGHAHAFQGRGEALGRLNRLEDALASFEAGIKISANAGYLRGARLYAKMKLCDWSGLSSDVSALMARIGRNEECSVPLAVLALTDSPDLQRKAAEFWVQDICPTSLALPTLARRRRTGRIRLGYFSADFRNHPVAFQAAGLFEAHDRSRFELIAFSFGSDIRDDMTRRIEAAFDRFIDVRGSSDANVALLARDLGLDIAVDLGGFTDHCRTEIFAMRAAPLQVSYLGYPGTMGAEYIDYLVADGILIPAASRQYYREKIVYLPNSYFVNDRQRAIAHRQFSREELGLPSTGFVFCCFNNSYKINPETFDAWMRILQRIEGSVLWLSKANPTAALNLRKAAEARGIRAARLIFAERMPLMEDHLARLRAADLFMDTLPYNAHSTASDVLWAGVPVLTRKGEAFAGRVAASLLHAIGLPELVTTTRERYEALAVELATDPARLGQIKLKLERNRLTMPLFDTELFARHLEDAYTQMYERYQAGLAPDHIHVSA
jgi:protein O-GlcNAc transferase